MFQVKMLHIVLLFCYIINLTTKDAARSFYKLPKIIVSPTDFKPLLVPFLSYKDIFF